MTAPLFPPPEGVVSIGDVRVRLDRSARSVVVSVPGHRDIVWTWSAAKAVAVGVLMAAKRLEGV